MRPISIDIPADWTDEEALLVFEFIDGIKDRIWDHYCIQIQSAAKSTRYIRITMESPDQSDEEDEFIDDDIPF